MSGSLGPANRSSSSHGRRPHGPYPPLLPMSAAVPIDDARRSTFAPSPSATARAHELLSCLAEAATSSSILPLPQPPTTPPSRSAAAFLTEPVAAKTPDTSYALTTTISPTTTPITATPTPDRPRRRANIIARAQIAATSREFSQELSPDLQDSPSASEMPSLLAPNPSKRPASPPPSSSPTTKSKSKSARTTHRLGDSSDDNSEDDDMQQPGTHRGSGRKGSGSGVRKPRRTPHSVIEKRRREKINTAYEELKNLIPNLDKPATHKLHILETSINYIRSLQDENIRLRSGCAVAVPPQDLSLNRSTSTEDTLYESSPPSSQPGSALTTPDLPPLVEMSHQATPTPLNLDRDRDRDHEMLQLDHHARKGSSGAIPVTSLLC